MKKSMAVAAGFVLALLTLGPAPAAPPPDEPANDQSPDLAEIRGYRLTQEKVDRLAAAAAAINQLTAADPKLKERMEEEDTDRPIDEIVKTMEAKFPQAVKAIRAAGLSPREFVVVELAFMNDLMMVDMKRQGLIKAYPPGTITAENAAFVEHRYEALAAIAKKIDPDEDDGDDDP